MIEKLVQLRQNPALRLGSLLLLVLALLALPLPQFLFEDSDLVTNSLLFSFTQMFMLVTLTSNWNMIGGYTGYIDFGHAVFFGLGAFGTGILMAKAGWLFPPAMLAGAVVAAVFAVLIGSATLRLKGPYFSIAMLGTFVAMREIVRVSKPLTGGGVGLTAVEIGHRMGAEVLVKNLLDAFEFARIIFHHNGCNVRSARYAASSGKHFLHRHVKTKRLHLFNLPNLLVNAPLLDLIHHIHQSG